MSPSPLAWGLFGPFPRAVRRSGLVLFIVTRDVPVGDVYGWRGATGILTLPYATMGALLAGWPRTRRSVWS